MTRRSAPLWIIALVVSACSDGTGPTKSAQPLRVVAVPAADTIEATPVQGLVVEVRDSSGRPSPGLAVRFHSLPVSSGWPFEFAVAVGSLTGSQFEDQHSTTSDDRGRATARVRYGNRAGTGRIEIVVPELGVADTVELTVRPGNPVGLLTQPRDTVLLVGGSLQLSGQAVDRYYNLHPVSASFSFLAVPAGIGVVTSTGTVTASGTGRIAVIAAVQQLRDTVHVSAVPPGWLAAHHQLDGNVVVTRFDGSGYRVVRPGVNGEVEFAWSPNGADLLLSPAQTRAQIDRLTFEGASTPIAVVDLPELGRVFSPTFSPDGQFIYFTNFEGSDQGVWRVNRDGTGPVAVTVGGLHERPSLSPDGRYLTYQFTGAGPFGPRNMVRVYDMASQVPVGPAVPGAFPEFSPTDQVIAFFEYETLRLRAMNRDGSGARYIASPDALFLPRQFSWSPDGRWLVATTYAEGLALVEVSTGLMVPLPWTYWLRNAAWRPQG